MNKIINYQCFNFNTPRQLLQFSISVSPSLDSPDNSIIDPESDDHPLNSASTWERWITDLEEYAKELEELEAAGNGKIPSSSSDSTILPENHSILGYGTDFDNYALLGTTSIAFIVGSLFGLKGAGITDPAKRSAAGVAARAFGLATLGTVTLAGILTLGVSKVMDVSSLREFSQKMSEIVPQHTQSLPDTFKPIRESAESLLKTEERSKQYKDKNKEM